MSALSRERAIEVDFFPSSHARAAELKLGYAVERCLEAAALFGAPGLGKTVLFRRVLGRAAVEGRAVADVYFPRIAADELLDVIEAELANEAGTVKPETGSRLTRIAAHVRKLTADDRGIIVAIDDAHLIRDPAVFEALHLLLNLREREGARLTILLAGQPSLLAAVAKQPSFAQRIGVSAALAPLSREDTAAFVRHRLSVMRCDAESFDAAAIAAVHERSFGVPRSVTRLCEMALLIAAADGRTDVTADDVAAADHECAGHRRDAA